MPKMQLVGLGRVNQGDKSKRSEKPYKLQDAHFAGKTLKVEGTTVAKVTIDHIENADNLPELLIGSNYIVDIDNGFLTGLELLDSSANAQPTTGRNIKMSNSQADS